MTDIQKLLLKIAAVFNLDWWVGVKIFGWTLETDGLPKWHRHFHTKSGWPVYRSDYCKKVSFRPISTAELDSAITGTLEALTADSHRDMECMIKSMQDHVFKSLGLPKKYMDKIGKDNHETTSGISMAIAHNRLLPRTDEDSKML